MGYETQKQEPFLDPGRLNGTFLTVTRGKVDHSLENWSLKQKQPLFAQKLAILHVLRNLKKKFFTGYKFIALLHCFSLPAGQLACLKRKTERRMYLGLLDFRTRGSIQTIP